MISIVIRVLNEANHLGALLDGIRGQDVGTEPVEIIIVDSGSTDGTVEIAERYQTRILNIRKEEFSFPPPLRVSS